MKLLELVNAAALKGGKTQDDAVLKDFLQKNSNIDVDVPKELEDAVNSLLNLKAAQNNQTVKDHYFKQFANATESTVYEDLETFGFDSAEVEELQKEESFFKREKKRGELLKAKLAAAKTKGNKEDVKTYTDQIAELNSNLAEAKRLNKEALEQNNQSWLNKLQSRDLNALLDSFEWADVYKQDRHLIGNARLNEKLNEIGAIVKYDGDKLVLKNASSPESDYYDKATNTPLGVKDVVSSIMSEKKYLKVADTPEQTTVVSSQNYNPGSPNGGTPGGSQAPPNPFRQRALQNLEELKKG